MAELFPVLTSLTIYSGPGSFLGGAFPHLQELHSNGIPLPALGSLLLSSSDLINLRLEEIPRSGYISPQAMATSMSASALTRFQSCKLELRSHRSCTNGEADVP